MSEANKGKGHKRSKAYYLKCAKQHRRNGMCMEPGQRGFLVTCNTKEKYCIRDTYALLNEFADKLYGPEMPTEKQSDEEQVGEDIEDVIQKEVENVKKTFQRERRFQALGSGAKNCIFIKAQLPDPSNLVHTIFKEMKSTQKQCSRYILRLIPVNAVCRAFFGDIKKTAEDLLGSYFQDTGPNGKTFAVIFKVRNNSTLSRNDIIPALASIIQHLNTANKADLTSPELAVIVNIIGKCCCLAVVPEYYQFKKYNLMELIDKAKAGVNVPEDVKTGLSSDELKQEKSELCDPVTLDTKPEEQSDCIHAEIKTLDTSAE